jgi:hypothetical protein
VLAEMWVFKVLRDLGHGPWGRDPQRLEDSPLGLGAGRS